MDPIEIVFSAGVAAVFGGVVGGLVSEWRTRAAETRAVKRERTTTFRDRQLRAIEETRLDYAAANETAFALAAGRPPGDHKALEAEDRGLQRLERAYRDQGRQWLEERVR